MKTNEMTVLNPAEKKRIYHFADGKTLTLENVTHLLVRDSGTHRLKANGKFWIVPVGWLGVEIDTEEWTL